MPRRLPALHPLAWAVAGALFLLAAGCATKPKPPLRPGPGPDLPVAPPEVLPPVALGIDVLEERKFDAVAGKRIGLLTHRPGVNRRGVSTVDVLHRAPGVKLVALFGPEHGLDGQVKAGDRVGDARHPGTGLPVYSLYGKSRKPSKEMLQGLDALVIDLQDIGSRSYTFISAMRYTMEACFENGVEVVVLDRPNPLGGLKVDGPPLDAELISYVGAFRVPYVHGLTMGELARMAKEAPGVLAVPDKVRERGRLTVIPMRGWTRAMRWPETGLKWIPTSPNIPDFDAAVGYAMTGLGCEYSGWKWGIGDKYPFRGIGFPKKKPDEIIAALKKYKIPGIAFTKRPGNGSDGKAMTGVYVEVTDWEAWRPTELSFYMHKQAAAWSAKNPFARLTEKEERSFNIHVGSLAWFKALKRDGARVHVPTFIDNWAGRAKIYQDNSRKYWLYP